jgi:DNA-binding CsgD family transcriptional regulator
LVELHALGLRPRRAARTGVAALTTAEFRVAQLAAAGAKSSKIAATLNLSPRTVEWHLQKVYRKLGVTHRAELASVLSEVET